MSSPIRTLTRTALRKSIQAALCLCLLLAVIAVSGVAQTQAPAAGKSAPQSSAQVTNPNTAADRDLAAESEAAGGEENAQFKRSKAVVWISHLIGVGPEYGYWIFVCLNFAIVAGFLYWASHTSLVQIQQHLAKLDSEVAEIRAAADADFSTEEQHIKQAAEEDARRVIETAESEIATAAKSARRELKVYAADLAVELAKKNIKVDAETDAGLVRGFVSQLGKDGK